MHPLYTIIFAMMILVHTMCFIKKGERYNAAGPGQAIDEDTRQRIAAITKTTDIKILVTLSCTMCPDLVVSAQRISAENPHVTAHVYDIRHFEDLKNRYKVMSVPCMVVNDLDVYFGKKTMQQVLELIK